MLKLITIVLGILSYLSAFAQDVPLTDYNWSTTDVTSRGLTKEKLFESMDRSLVKVGQSICSNRALMWVYDFKRHYDIDASKIFLFYTGKTGRVGARTWWYHVAPVIAEKSRLWVMDAGFTRGVSAPLTIQTWLKDFIGSDHCKEIHANETSLIERMYYGQTFPETTEHGTFDCYYKVVPAGYWTPSSVAKNLLGRDEAGKPVTFVRDQISLEEVYMACKEAVTSSLGYVLGSGKNKCKKYLGID